MDDQGARPDAGGSADAAPAGPAAAGGGASPLTPEQVEAIRTARARREVLERATKLATFNGWSTGILAALSAPFAPFSLLGAFACVGLATVAYLEFRGRGMIRQLDPGGPRLLGWNQVGFGVLILIYCAWSLLAALYGPNPYAEYIEQEPQLREMLGSIDELYQVGAVVVYGAVAALALPYQAAMAWYYFSRAPKLEAYVRETPAWVTEMERTAHP